MAAHWYDDSNLAKALQALRKRKQLEWDARASTLLCLIGTLLLACIAAALWLWLGQGWSVLGR